MDSPYPDSDGTHPTPQYPMPRPQPQQQYAQEQYPQQPPPPVPRRSGLPGCAMIVAVTIMVILTAGAIGSYLVYHSVKSGISSATRELEPDKDYTFTQTSCNLDPENAGRFILVGDLMNNTGESRRLTLEWVVEVGGVQRSQRGTMTSDKLAPGQIQRLSSSASLSEVTETGVCAVRQVNFSI